MLTISVSINQVLFDKAVIRAKSRNLTASEQIEHWAKIGKMMEDNPDLPYEFVQQAIIAQAEKEAGELEVYHFD